MNINAPEDMLMQFLMHAAMLTWSVRRSQQCKAQWWAACLRAAWTRPSQPSTRGRSAARPLRQRVRFHPDLCNGCLAAARDAATCPSWLLHCCDTETPLQSCRRCCLVWATHLLTALSWRTRRWTSRPSSGTPFSAGTMRRTPALLSRCTPDASLKVWAPLAEVTQHWSLFPAKAF